MGGRQPSEDGIAFEAAVRDEARAIIDDGTRGGVSFVPATEPGIK